MAVSPFAQGRAFYETLGKVYPPACNVSMDEITIAGVKNY